MKQVVISISETGARFVSSVEAENLMGGVFEFEKERATHVEPVNRVLRALFYLIRDRVDDSHCLAWFTRQWPCSWQARLVRTDEIIATGRNRKDVIAQEVEYLEANEL